MKLILLLISFLGSSLLNILLAEPPAYITTGDGVIIYTDPLVTGMSNAVKLEVIADNIIRVIVAPGKEIAPTQSLVTVYNKRRDLSWSSVASKERLTLKTKTLTAIVNLRSGVVSFGDLRGKKILSEKPNSGRSFQPVMFDGKQYYHLSHTFQTIPGVDLYGLGQHHDGIMNYRAQHVTLYQNNTEVAVPFLISSKNYGILWDNYSLTTVGDVRPLHRLSALQLFSKKNEPGWITALYANDKHKPGEIITEKAETDIDMEFLGDSKIHLPGASVVIVSGNTNWSIGNSATWRTANAAITTGNDKNTFTVQSNSSTIERSAMIPVSSPMDGITYPMHNAGIKAIFGTPTYAVPAWLAVKHPGVFVERMHSSERSYGIGQNFYIANTAYFFYIERIIRKILEHFAKHSVIIGYQVENETTNLRRC